MYFPYMRGKQFELTALKDVAQRLNPSKIFPIIEPVSTNLGKLVTCIQELNNNRIIPHIVLNPEVGEIASDSPTELNLDLSTNKINFIRCFRLNNHNFQYAQPLLDQFIADKVNYSLYFQEAITFDISKYTSQAICNVVREVNRYPNTFVQALPNAVIITDSFPAKTRNADYSHIEQFFSDAHLTYATPLINHQIGFGDYLTIDETWVTGGGPAFVVAIHITYIDSVSQNMYVKHCASVTNMDDQSNPAGKFREALAEMILFANKTQSLNQNTLGFQEYAKIYQNGTYHGLGIPKKLSMMHHIETISNYL